MTKLGAMEEPMKRLMLAIISFYRRAISPHLPGACRYYPTCSQYAMTAIERYGALKGGWMGFKRILRCHPLHKGGYDPVPELPDAVIRRN